jgi:hypothetical protein
LESTGLVLELMTFASVSASIHQEALKNHRPSLWTQTSQTGARRILPSDPTGHSLVEEDHTFHFLSYDSYTRLPEIIIFGKEGMDKVNYLMSETEIYSVPAFSLPLHIYIYIHHFALSILNLFLIDM